MSQRNGDRDSGPVRLLFDPLRTEGEATALDRAIRIALLGWSCVAILTFLVTMVWVILF